MLVAGQRLSIRTSAPADYVHELADFVTGKIDELRQSGPSVPTQSIALLAAMNVADELIRLRENHARLKSEIRERTKRVLKLVEQRLNAPDTINASDTIDVPPD